MNSGTAAATVAPAREASQRFANSFTMAERAGGFGFSCFADQGAECRHGGPLIFRQ